MKHIVQTLKNDILDDEARHTAILIIACATKPASHLYCHTSCTSSHHHLGVNGVEGVWIAAYEEKSVF